MIHTAVILPSKSRCVNSAAKASGAGADVGTVRVSSSVALMQPSWLTRAKISNPVVIMENSGDMDGGILMVFFLNLKIKTPTIDPLSA